MILLDGEVEIIKSMGTSDERRMALRGQGTFLGEMSMFNLASTHSASVRARTDLSSLVMSRDNFEGLIRRHPEVTY